MSSAIRASPPTLPLHTTRSGASRHVSNSSLMFPLASHPVSCSKSTRIEALTNFSEGGPVPGLESAPVSVELEPVPSESQFDRVIAEAQQLEESVVVVWMASWCRKCIYLKPKLEKLAADYYPRIRFYCVDVNNVPRKLVVRAGITVTLFMFWDVPGSKTLQKMPIIQLWKDSKKQAEVIGGHKAYLVVKEVREMIENEGTM